MDSDARLHLLGELTLIAAHRAGKAAICISTTALVVETAKRLDISLRPLPVSIWTKGASDSASTGKPGRDFGLTLTSRVTVSEVGETEWFRNVGHMVAALDEDPGALFDASFRQFSKFGLPDMPIVCRLRARVPAEGPIAFALQAAGGENVEIRYWPMEQDRSWVDDYNNEARQAGALADDIADFLRSGGTAKQFAALDL